MWIYKHDLRSPRTMISAFLKVKQTDLPGHKNYLQGRGKDKASVGWDALLSSVAPRQDGSNRNQRAVVKLLTSARRFINEVFTAVTKVT